jgi:L-serine/L-threonine ammonia-lyase
VSQTRHQGSRGGKPWFLIVDKLYCPPFDHEDVIDGNASMVHEIIEQMKGQIPDAIVCCVGGGGLIGGVFKGLQTTNTPGWDKGILFDFESDIVTVVGVETHGSASFHAAWKAGEHVGIPEINTIAKSLGAKKISSITFNLMKHHRGHVKAMVVSDAQAANASWRFAGHHLHNGANGDDQRIMVEIAGGSALSMIYEGLLKAAVPCLTKSSTVVMIVCGGIPSS